MQKSKKTEIEKSEKDICRKMEFKNLANIVFTQHLRNQEQVVIILKTFKYYIHIIVYIEFNN